jgi:hypothetical protein
MSLEDLVEQRVAEAQYLTGDFPFTLTIVDGKLFPALRDYAFCHYDRHTNEITIGVAPKFLRAHPTTQDALLRHELGHAIDFIIPPRTLNKYARSQGRVLSSTPERRADDIAYLVWGDKIRYDHNLIQTLNTGIYPRPPEIGL